MPSIAIATPSLDAYSETFIRAHIERLPAKVHVLYGGLPPALCDAGKVLIPPYSTWQALFRHLMRQDWHQWQQRHLARGLRRLGVGVLLAEYGPTGVAVSHACRMAGIPLVVFFHGYDAWNVSVIQQFEHEYPSLFESCSALIVNSDSMARRLEQLGARSEKIHKAPCGVDVFFFCPASAYPPPNVHFVSVGRFVHKKAPYLTLLAFYKVLQSLPRARLTMIGDGPLREVCIRMATALGISEQVAYPGVCSPATVRDTMHRATVFVQHSVQAYDGDSESLGVALLEASACGLPIVATRHDGIPEAVIDGQTGILVDEGDVDGMAEAMIYLARNPNLAARMGAAGRARVEAEFSMEKSIGNLWHILQSVMEGR